MPRLGNHFASASVEVQRAVARLLENAGKVIPLPEGFGARIRNVGSGERPVSAKPGSGRGHRDDKRDPRAGGDDTQ